MSAATPFTYDSGLRFSSTAMQAISISDYADLRIYSDTRPHNWKIADLQKGLILVYKGREVVGEGAGFGVPVLVCSDETYFSGTSRVYFSKRGNCMIVRKDFEMNRIVRNKFRNVTLENRKTRRFFTYLAHLYQRHTEFRFLTLKSLTRKMYIDTAFLKIPSIGKAQVTYLIEHDHILVKADFRQLKKTKTERVFILNEQGSSFFRKYIDSRNMELTDSEIGAWDNVEAEWASLKFLQQEFGFRLRRTRDSVLRRGREFLEGSMDWIGLDYEINPRSPIFEYSIEILGL